MKTNKIAMLESKLYTSEKACELLYRGYENANKELTKLRNNEPRPNKRG